MTTFNSPKYRSLVVKFSSRERVKFENGTAEVEGDLADRLRQFAKDRPDYNITADDGGSGRKTHKQELQEQARDLGLDDSGTVKELQARIAAELDALADADGDEDEDSDDSEDENPDE